MKYSKEIFWIFQWNIPCYWRWFTILTIAVVFQWGKTLFRRINIRFLKKKFIKCVNLTEAWISEFFFTFFFRNVKKIELLCKSLDSSFFLKVTLLLSLSTVLRAQWKYIVYIDLPSHGNTTLKDLIVTTINALWHVHQCYYTETMRKVSLLLPPLFFILSLFLSNSLYIPERMDRTLITFWKVYYNISSARSFEANHPSSSFPFSAFSPLF